MAGPGPSPARAGILAAAVALAGCELLQPPPRAPASEPRPARVAPAPAPAPAPAAAAPDRPGLKTDDYRKEIAYAIVRANADGVFSGKLPPLLRSVVVVQVSIDDRGMPARVTLFRSNGFEELSRSAIAAIYRAAPYPIPGRSLLGGASTFDFTESFLFRADGRFQVRTIAEEQSTDVGPDPSLHTARSRRPAGK